MKDILIITNYFPPETGAASNRIFHLAEGLKQRGFGISVVTPLPNYPTGRVFSEYKGKLRSLENKNGITIHRLWLYASNSKNKLLRLFAMLSYSFSLLWFFLFNKIPNTVIIQSPPLIVAFTSVLFLKSNRRKLVLNVSDLWPLAGLELGAFKKGVSYNILERIERFNYNKVDLILGQSEEILSHVLSIVPEKETLLYRNFPEFETKLQKDYKTPVKTIKIVYAGLLGMAQGVFKLCQNLDYSNVEFHIYGTGAEATKIELFIKKNPEFSIIYHGELKRDALHSVLIQYDLAIIPLLNRIYGSVPSKIFEFSKLGLPLLYFGGGEGEVLVNKYKLGWVVPVGDYTALNQQILNLNLDDLNESLRTNIKKTADSYFNLTIQLNALERFISN